MADRFDVVAVGVQHKSAIVVGMILRSRSRRAVVAAARGPRRLVESIDLRPRLGAKSNVYGRHIRLSLPDPEVRFGRNAEARKLLEPLRNTQGSVSQIALTLLGELPQQ